MSKGTKQPRAPKPREQPGQAKPRISRKTWALIIGLATVTFVLPLALRVFVLEAFKVPAGSMYPSVLIGDHLFVAKWGYGCQGCTPERGRVFVFRYPGPEPVDFVKRVIALPGDELEVVSGALVINGWNVPRCSLGRAEVQEPEGGSHTYEVLVEFLQGHSYLVALDVERDDGHQGPYRVAANEAWVLGDNRNNSSDSRSWRAGQGAGVPFENFRGPIWSLWFPPERLGVRTEGAPTLPPELQSLAPALSACLAKAPSLADSTPPRR